VRILDFPPAPDVRTRVGEKLGSEENAVILPPGLTTYQHFPKKI
jgi:hypothetical protein